jgi:3-hydroxyacyl-CoA dehydrogenase
MTSRPTRWQGRCPDRPQYRTAGLKAARSRRGQGRRNGAHPHHHQIADLGPTDLIIEAATERETVKQAIFEDLLPHIQPHTILTSNTSSISITRLASRTDRPEKFMGFHFMNPVPVMQLVELIRGIATDEPTYTALHDVVKKLGKTAASAEDFPAFIVNRILMPMINEAVYTLYEGVGSVKSIDESLKLGANHPMGPLELADFIGLDTCLAIMNVLHDGLADTKYRPCPLLTKYVEAGWLGRKTSAASTITAATCPCPRADAAHGEVPFLRPLLMRERHGNHEPADFLNLGQQRPGQDLVVGADAADQFGKDHPVHQPVRVVCDDDKRAVARDAGNFGTGGSQTDPHGAQRL